MGAEGLLSGLGVSSPEASGRLVPGGHDRLTGHVREHVTVHDEFDVTLEDADLLGEVELTTNLIIAASEADEHLSIGEIDEILGLDAAGGTGEPRRAG